MTDPTTPATPAAPKKAGLSDSTKRTLRTAFQALIAVITGFPIVLVALPSDFAKSAVVILMGVWIPIISKLIDTLEDKGLIPAWLKD